MANNPPGSIQSDSKIKELLHSLTDALNEQVWFREAKQKWEELDPQSKKNLQLATFGIAVLATFATILMSIWSVHSLKNELTEKQNLMNVIQTADDEVRRLRDALPSQALAGANDAMSWTQYFESIAATAGFDKNNLSVSQEKAGPTNDLSKEFLYEISLKHLNVKQIVKYAFHLENGQRSVKLKNLSIDAKSDLSGYLDATLSVSAFSMVKHE